MKTRVLMVIEQLDGILKKIESDFNLLNNKFQKASVELALKYPKEVTPLLIRLLEPAMKNPENMDISYNGHIYATYLLAAFKEPQAFPLLLEISQLTDDELDLDIDDCITDNLHWFISATYNNNFPELAELLESQNTSVWTKHTLLFTLLMLCEKGTLTTDFLSNYYSELFKNPAYAPDNDIYISLIRVCYELDAKYFYKIISKTLVTIDLEHIYITNNSLEKKAANPKYNLRNESSPNLEFVNDVINEMKCLSCFD